MGPAGLRLLLIPASLLYAAGWSAYRSLYQLGLKRAAQPFAPILCVGNLTVGGSGKTPLTIHVARCLAEMGYRPVIGCSGYGSPASEGAAWAPDGPLDPALWGDEPALIRDQLADVPLVVGRRRVLAAQLVAERAGPGTVLVLDDGFQHLPLRKSASIVLDPPGSNRWCLPAGPYREPRLNLRLADLVLGPPQAELRVVSAITGLQTLHGREPIDFPKEADALCGIGRPHAFFDALRERCHLRASVALADHSSLLGALDRVSDPVLVTGKDAVKLREMPESRGRDVRVVCHEVRVEPHDLFVSRLKEWVERRG